MTYMNNGFVNPYNFIAFPKEKAKAYDDKDKHTGYIEYTLETLTPLFIPNSSTENAFSESSSIDGHKSYDFFSYTELDESKEYENEYHEPVIPGSEIRGVIRSVYETLTDSCMGILNSDVHPVKRTLEQFRPGLIHRTEGHLEILEIIEARAFSIGDKAEKDSFPQDLPLKNGCHNGSVVYINNSQLKGKSNVVKDYRDSKQKDYQTASYLLKRGMGVKKTRYHVYTPKNEHVAIKELKIDEISRRITALIDSYVSQPSVDDNNKKAYEEYRTDFIEFLNQKGKGYFPVNYSIIGNKEYYISPAAYTKEISVNSIEKIAGQFVPCIEDSRCPACDMFGYIGKSNENAQGSKVRFSDLHVTKQKSQNSEYYTCNKVTLPALSNPKLGNIEFYLKKPSDDALFWTYDYYIDGEGKLHIKPGELRGRKFYWHHSQVSVNDIKVEATNLNKTIRPVKKGIKFSGRLYFDGISKKQLRQLIWILGNGKEGLGYKIGSAKPYGLGSVACYINNVVERKINIINNNLKYSMIENKDVDITYEQAEFSQQVKKEFEKIASIKAFPENVRITYPKAKDSDSDKGFEWFDNNHITKSGKTMVKTRNDMKIRETLPYILDNNYMLSYNGNIHKSDKDSRNRNNSKKGNNRAGRTKGSNRY